MSNNISNDIDSVEVMLPIQQSSEKNKFFIEESNELLFESIDENLEKFSLQDIPLEIIDNPELIQTDLEQQAIQQSLVDYNDEINTHNEHNNGLLPLEEISKENSSNHENKNNQITEFDINQNEIQESTAEQPNNQMNASNSSLAQSNQSVINKILDYVKSPIREDREDLIDSLIELGNSLESIGVEAHQLSQALDETERLRLKTLQENSKVGLNENEFPIGKISAADLLPVAFIYTPKVVNETVLNFHKCLLSIVNAKDSETKVHQVSIGKQLIQILKNDNIDPKRYIENQNQKKAYFSLVFSDDRMTRTELDLMLNFMKNSAFANKKVLKQREEYYESKSKNIDIDFPDIKPLLNDVKKLKSTLTIKLEELPEILTSNEKQYLKEYLPALDEYYKDQIAAFSGGNAYLPLAKNLQNIQIEIEKNPYAKNVIIQAQSLGFTMQRLYVLHWIAESIMKKKYNTTLGKALNLYLKDFPDNIIFVESLQNAVKFRNDIAHNGLIWNPKDFERHIISYEAGIDFLSSELNIELDSYRLGQIHRPLNKHELRRMISENIGLKESLIEQIDNQIFTIDSINKQQRLKAIVTGLKKIKKITAEKLHEIDPTILKTIYHEKGKVKNIIESMEINDLITNYFAKKYFQRNFIKLVEDVCKKQNSDKQKVRNWLYRLSMLEKDDLIGSDELRRIKELRNSLL